MRIVHPGSGRLTLILLAMVPAVMACPWRTVPERWLLGGAVVAMVLLLGRWRGVPLTTIAGLWLALLSRRHRSSGGTHPCDRRRTDARTTVVLRVVEGSGEIPLDLIASYLDRYGVRCESLRITSRDGASGHRMWIGLTMTVAANLAALQARSTSIPLRRTAELVARRLADEMRERGWTLSGADLDIPDLLGPQARERWGTVDDGTSSYVTAYRITGRSPSETLMSLWASGFDELWTAVEVSDQGVVAVCAIRGADRPGTAVPVPGLVPRRGTQRAALQAMIPTSTTRLGSPEFEAGEFSAIRWRAGAVVVGA